MAAYYSYRLFSSGPSCLAFFLAWILMRLLEAGAIAPMLETSNVPEVREHPLTDFDEPYLENDCLQLVSRTRQLQVESEALYCISI